MAERREVAERRMAAPVGKRAARRLDLRPSVAALLVVLVAGAAASGTALVGLWLLGASQAHAIEAAHERVSRAAPTIQRIYADRLERMAYAAQTIATRSSIVDVTAAHDPQAAADALQASRAAARLGEQVTLIDAGGAALADVPPRAGVQRYDFKKKVGIVRTVLSATSSPSQPWPRQIAVRPLEGRPYNDVGLAAAFPVSKDEQVIGAVLLWRRFDDVQMRDFASATGLDVALVTRDTLLAGSPGVSELLAPPRVRPAGQVLAPVGRIQLIGDEPFIAAGEPLRSRVPWSYPGVNPVMLGPVPGADEPPQTERPAGQTTIATLFAGTRLSDVVAPYEALRRRLRLVIAAATITAGAAALVAAWLICHPVRVAASSLAAGLNGAPDGPPRAAALGVLREPASLLTVVNRAVDATSSKLQLVHDQLRTRDAVIDSVSEGIIVLDQQARLVFVNQSAQRLLGLPAGLPSGTSLRAVLTGRQWDALAAAIVQQDRFAGEVHLDEPRQVILRLDSVPVYDDAARLLERALLLKDITEERLLDNVKADFFTAMSHELRTPLSAIKGAAELLLDDHLPSTQDHFVQTIHRNADRLGRLVTDLLDLSKLESGRVSLRLARIDLNEVVSGVVAALDPMTRRDALRLTCRLGPGGLAFVADHDRIEQIVTNLVSNAYQYTPAGGDIVVCTWRDGNNVCLSVQDTGIGISAVDQQHLFDKFYQGVQALTHKRGGSGLGLTIVKYLTELHGGRIDVQSRLGIGSTFTVRLPIAPAMARREAPAGPSQPLLQADGAERMT